MQTIDLETTWIHKALRPQRAAVNRCLQALALCKVNGRSLHIDNKTKIVHARFTPVQRVVITVEPRSNGASFTLVTPFKP
jgi:hypothetical protein